MNTSIFKLAIHPNELAVCKSDSHIVGGTFFLDFSRPIVIYRKIGLIRSLGVPVVHEGEYQGGFVISVAKKDPNLAEAEMKAHLEDVIHTLRETLDLTIDL